MRPRRSRPNATPLLTLVALAIACGLLPTSLPPVRLLSSVPQAAAAEPGEAQRSGKPTGATDSSEWFEREVRPLLAERCLSCHSSGLEAPKANLKLDRRQFVLAGGDSGPAIVPGQPDESLLLQAVRGEGLEMPPDKPLSKAEQATLERWIRLGAPWPETELATVASGPDWLVSRARTHWAWQPVRDHVPPEVHTVAWPARPLDAFVLDKLERHDLRPATQASETALLRRLYFDLTGLPPSAAQAREFTSRTTAQSAHDGAARDRYGTFPLDDETAYAQLVERLMASPQFGVTWGRHWLDLVRYCETLGHEFDYPVRHAWRYRDAVIDALNTDVAYDQFVFDHIAGDRNAAPRRHPLSGINQSLALTGWWWMGEGLHAPVDVLGDEATRLDNQIDVYSKTFLGLTVACARCHDHKFDALSAADYTSLVGILQSSRRTYAVDDPHRAIAQHNRELLGLQRQACSDWNRRNSAAPLAGGAQAFEVWIDHCLAKLRENLAENRRGFPDHHPLSSLLLLAEAQDAKDFDTRQRVLTERLKKLEKDFAAWQAASPKLADFSAGLPSGWTVEAADPRVAELAAQPPDKWLAFDPVAALPTRGGTFASHVLGRQQHLTLRSPTFELTHPVVALRMRGKSAQSTVVVDNYYMIEFHGLLFGDLRKPIDQSSDWGWVVHQGDLTKYQNHPAYLSIEDDENAWFELSEVRLSDSPPPQQPNPVSVQLTSSEASRGAAGLKQSLAAALARAWQRASAASGHDRPSNAELELLRSAMVEAERLQVPLPIAAFDRESLEQHAAATPQPTRLIAMCDGTPRNASLAIRGNPHQLGEPVPRGDLQALGGELFTADDSSGRRELAAKLASRQHPLVARVMVNRVWLHLLGQGLVDSPDNFGLLGGAPSHAELLDYLTERFIEHDWSIKWLVREICMSRTYRLASRSTAEQAEQDPAGRMLSHRQVRRLSAEKLRDAMLAISGSLDRAAGGESVPVHLTEQMTGRGRPKASGPLDADGRRSVFIEIRRNFLDPFLIAFDQPPPATTVGKRNLSNVPAQALSMLNDPLVHELAQRWSVRLQSECATPEARVQAMFWTAFARPPSDRELADCVAALATESGTAQGDQPSTLRLAELAHVLLCAKEFQYLP
jgi:hypothetical protein